jgi:signal transduction histidine kinase
LQLSTCARYEMPVRDPADRRAPTRPSTAPSGAASQPPGPVSGIWHTQAAHDQSGEREAVLEVQLVHANHLANIGMLAAGIGHEIRNPLTCLVANLDLAIRDLSDLAAQHAASEPARDCVARAVGRLRDAAEAADHIRQIACDLKPQPPSSDQRHGAASLQRVIDSSLRMASSEIRGRARLVNDYADLPDVEGSELRLGQVFLNLLMNAAQAIPEGRADENEIGVSARVEGDDWVVVEVKDTGSGIAPENVAHIFDPFFTTKAAGEGTGLGLAICQTLVTESGGRIDVQSEVGKGSVFRVTLPICRAG